MIQTQIATNDLFDACLVLFGPRVHASIAFLNYLKPAGVKSAYRQKALDTHPDRAQIIGTDPVELKVQFCKTKAAYEKLNDYVRGSKQFAFKPTPPVKKPRRPSSTKTTNKDFFFAGNRPMRPLLFGQYLYYSGIISWHTFISAVAWQKKRQIRVGQLAVRLGMLLNHHVFSILREKRSREKFGEGAVRLGYLTHSELLLLLTRQNRLHRPIGNFFIRQGILTSSRVLSLVARQRVHNRRFS